MLDLENILKLVEAYITKNFDENIKPKEFVAHGILRNEILSEVDFIKLFSQTKNGYETFSEMLLRLIKESGASNADIYKSANIDRRHFSKIVNHPDYKPSKQTVLAFAIALKLNFGTAKELLAVAGFALSKANLFDVIVSFFIEYKIYDVDLVNQVLYKYNQPLLGG